MYSKQMIAAAHQRLGLPADPVSVDEKWHEMIEAFSNRLSSLRFEMQRRYSLENPEVSDPPPHEPLFIMHNRTYAQAKEMILDEFINEPIRALAEHEDYSNDEYGPNEL